MANGAATVAGAQAPAQPAKRVKRKQQGGVPLFRWLTQNIVWELFIVACIIANAAILGYDAHYGEDNRYHALIEQWNMYFLWIFTAELGFEFLAQGPRRYFSRGWNIFDMIVVGLSYVAVNPAISALRTLRVVRVFRLISAVPQMRRVVEALFGAMPGILATLAILVIVFYIGAVMGTTLFHNEPGFRDLGESALSLFALSQFDGWATRSRAYSRTIRSLGFSCWFSPWSRRLRCSICSSASSLKPCRPRRMKRSRKRSTNWKRKSKASLKRKKTPPLCSVAFLKKCVRCARRSPPCVARRQLNPATRPSRVARARY